MLTADRCRRCAEVASAGTALKDHRIALATVKDHALFQHGNALKLLRASAANASLKDHLHVKANGNRIKALIDLDGIDPDLRPYDFCAFCANGSTMLQNLVSVAREIDAYVLEAITVTAGVQHPLGVDTHGLAGGSCAGAGKSVFRHNSLSPFHFVRENALLAIILCKSPFFDTGY